MNNLFATFCLRFTRTISKTVSRLGENSSSRPAPVFVEFEYSVIDGKMFFQQEITDAEVSTYFGSVGCVARVPSMAPVFDSSVLN